MDAGVEQKVMGGQGPETRVFLDLRPLTRVHSQGPAAGSPRPCPRSPTRKKKETESALIKPHTGTGVRRGRATCPQPSLCAANPVQVSAGSPWSISPCN